MEYTIKEHGLSVPVDLIRKSEHFVFEGHGVCVIVGKQARKLPNNNQSVNMPCPGTKDNELLELGELLSAYEFLVFSYKFNELFILETRSIVYPLKQVGPAKFESVVDRPDNRDVGYATPEEAARDMAE